VHFLLLDRPVDDDSLRGAPPPVHRWRAAEQLLAAGAPGSQVAVVDADTMIRWDAPDFFALAGGSLAAVRDREPDWIVRSIRAYQPFFPGVALDWWDYFNSGLVVFARDQAHVLRALVDTYRRNRAELAAVQRRTDVGVDQTLLNFVVRLKQEPITFLPAPFNLMHCLPIPLLTLIELESATPEQRRRQLVDEIMRTPGMFDFVDHSYVWHYNNTVAIRADFMRETWRRISDHYPD
jgi:hypothetical protein